MGGPEGIDVKAPEYQALSAKTNPDLVYYSGITQNNAGRLFRDLRAALGSGVMLMGPDGIYEQAFLDDAGPAAEGTYVTFGVMPPSLLVGKGADWYAAYKIRFGSEPEVYASYGYEAAKVTLDAIGRVGVKDRDAIRAAVLATAEYEGILGTWSFDPNGDTSLSTMSGRQVVGGRFDEENARVLDVRVPLP
jgi:branched-chain amino acid transport system substrate-binding protein